jgi:hypothetical protein
MRAATGLFGVVCVLCQAVAYHGVVAAEGKDGLGVQYHFLVGGLGHERERLRNGVFRAHGVKTLKAEPSAGTVTGDVYVFGAFDVSKGQWRFDRSEPEWGSPIATGSVPRSQKVPSMTTRYCRNSEFSAHYNSKFRRVELHTPETIGPGSMPGTNRFFDVRCLGLYHWGRFLRGDRFEEVQESFFERLPVECEDEGEGRYRLCWMREVSRQTLWIDERRGFAPVRLVIQHKFRDLGDTDWREPYYVSEVAWKRLSDVWVPEAFRVVNKEELSGPGASKGDSTPKHRTTSYTLAFDWESVNGSVSDAYFRYDGFESPEGTYVTDFRSGEPVMIGVVGRTSTSLPSRSSWTVGRALSVVGIVLLVVGGVLCWWIRHRNLRVS